jgi:hypothetical protein
MPYIIGGLTFGLGNLLTENLSRSTTVHNVVISGQLDKEL